MFLLELYGYEAMNKKLNTEFGGDPMHCRTRSQLSDLSMLDWAVCSMTLCAMMRLLTVVVI